MSTPEQQREALEALQQAHAIYRQADAHRSELIGLCRALDLPLVQIEEAIGVRHPDREGSE